VDEEAAVREVIRALVAAWNGGDAHAFAELFAPSAEYVTGQGRCIRGRDAIAALVGAARPGPQVRVVRGPSAESRGPDWTVRFGWVAGVPGRAVRQGGVTCTLAEYGDRWLIETLRNEEGT